MFKNYVTIAFRNLVRNKNYTLLNICGLALGMTIVIFIALFINDELSFNKYHRNYYHLAKVYRMNSTGMVSQIVTTGFGTQLKNKYGSHFKFIALLRQRLEQRIIEFDTKKFTEGGYFVQADLPKMFTLNMIYGSRDGLDGFRTILISNSLSRKLFGSENPVNQTIKFGGEWDLKIAGVYKDLPLNTELSDAQFFAPLDIYLHGWSNLNVWDNYNMRLYVQINNKENFTDITSIIKDSMQPFLNESAVKSNLELFLHPMSAWHLDSKFENGEKVLSEKKIIVWLLAAAGIFILFLACINFINLSTACSERRVKEIGIRKTLGSLKKNLTLQFLNESFVISLIAFLISLLSIEIFLPAFNELVSKDLTLPWVNKYFWIISFGFLIITSIFAGGYPALYLASFNPVRALSGKIQHQNSSIISRNILVVLQFTVSIIFISASLIVYNQIQFAKDRPVGFKREGLISLKPQIPSNKAEVLRTALKKTGVINEVAQASNAITNTYGWIGGIDWIGKDRRFKPSVNYVLADYNYCKTMGLQFIQGRDFSKDLAGDYTSMIINNTAQRILGIDNPIGMNITCPNIDESRSKYEIIGVVEDMVKGSPYAESIPTIIILSKRDIKFTYLRLNPEVSIAEALPVIEDTFEEVIPSIPFNYEFVDDIHNAKFKAEERLGELAGLSALLSLVISCLGIFGLSSFMVSKRIREIGIRKVFGASIPNILKLLTSNFAKLVIAANLFAWPVTYYFMNKWLLNFAYRIDVSWQVFVLAGGVALIIAILTVGIQAVKAALANPVESLKYE